MKQSDYEKLSEEDKALYRHLRKDPEVLMDTLKDCIIALLSQHLGMRTLLEGSVRGAIHKPDLTEDEKQVACSMAESLPSWATDTRTLSLMLEMARSVGANYHISEERADKLYELISGTFNRIKLEETLFRSPD